MGFFDKILKGLGFEDEDAPVEKEPKPKVKKNKKKNSVSATFNLNMLDNETKEETNTQALEDVNSNNVNAKQNQGSDFEMVKVLNQIDVQQAINKLKNGGRILLNTEGLSGQDLVRSLDFLTGAVYALNLKMQKLDEKLYLIQ